MVSTIDLEIPDWQDLRCPAPRSFLDGCVGGERRYKAGSESKLSDNLQEFPIGGSRFFNFVRLFVRGTDKKEPTEVIS